MIPLAIVAIWPIRDRLPLAAAALALGAMALVLRSEPNTRYLYPELPLLFIPLAALLQWVHVRQRALYGALLAFLLVALALDVHFMPASGWNHREFYPQLVFAPNGRERILQQSEPYRDVVRHFSHEHPHEPVLILTDNDIADVTAEVYIPVWHQYSVWQRVQQTVSRLDMLRLLEQWNVRYLVAETPAPGTIVEPRGVRDLLNRCKLVEYQNRRFYEAKVDPQCFTELHQASDQPTLAARGAYDDFDIELRFRGEWTRADNFPNASEHTESYTDLTGAEVSIAFEGQALTYIFAKAPNRGMAELTIDGVVKATIDLYSPNVEWQSRYRFCCLDAGRHLATVRVLGLSRPSATGRFVDVDGFVVE